MRVAVVGAGVSGLTAAYLLSRDHAVTLFETSERLGGHAHTVRVERDGDVADVDTGFLVYNDRTYPLFIRLLGELGVATQPSTMSFSYADSRSGFEWKGSTLNSVFAQRRNLWRPSFWRMLVDIVSFNRAMRAVAASDTAEHATLADVLASGSWGRKFRECYLVPMGASIWSASPLSFTEIPARTFAEFFERHGLLRMTQRPQWRTVTGGSRRYVDEIERRLRERGAEIVPRAVISIRRGNEEVVVTTSHETSTFDHVVVACHSDQALALLDDPTSDERRLLGAIRYQSNDVTLHVDETLLPRSARAHAAWNYRRFADDDARATLTYDVSRLQSLSGGPRYLVTLNSDAHIDASAVVRRFVYEHPVLDAAAIRAQRERHLLNVGRTSYCGAYWYYGFHEDGVRSAGDVAASLGVTWETT